MGALANRDFVKMNGLGNEIVVVDLRRGASAIEAAEARAAARQEPYDQLMALYPARGDEDAAIRIYNNDGSEAGACGNGMRCVAALLSEETGRSRTQIRNFRRCSGVLAREKRAVHRRYGPAAIALGRDSVGAGVRRYARYRTGNRSARRADPAFAVRCQHGQPARHLLGRRSVGLRSRQDRAAARTPSDVSRARQYYARRDAVARPCRDPHLGTRRRADQGLRLGGLRRRRRRGAA